MHTAETAVSIAGIVIFAEAFALCSQSKEPGGQIVVSAAAAKAASARPRATM